MAVADYKFLIPIAISFLALLFNIAKASAEEKAKVLGWGKISLGFIMLAGIIIFSFMAIYNFVVETEPPTRRQIFMFVVSVINAGMYSKYLSRYIYELLDRRVKAEAATALAEKEIQAEHIRTERELSFVRSIRADVAKMMAEVPVSVEPPKT